MEAGKPRFETKMAKIISKDKAALRLKFKTVKNYWNVSIRYQKDSRRNRSKNVRMLTVENHFKK